MAECRFDEVYTNAGEDLTVAVIRARLTALARLASAASRSRLQGYPVLHNTDEIIRGCMTGLWHICRGTHISVKFI